MILESILEEMSLDECCSSLLESSNPVNKFANVVTLALKFKDGGSLDEGQADSLLTSSFTELVSQLLRDPSEELNGYKKLVHNVSTTLLSLCGDETYVNQMDLILANLDYLKSKPIGKEDACTVLRLFRPNLIADTHSEFPAVAITILAKFATNDEKVLPEIDHLHVFASLLKLIGPPLSSVASEVPVLLRKVVSRILHSPPQRLHDSYRKASFEIIRELCSLCGATWLEPEPKLLCLIAHLVSAQMRIVLDDPKKIDFSQLVTCLAIAETCIQSVDEEEFVDDDNALLISKAVRDGAVFVIEYWGQAKEIKEDLPLEVECTLYRFVCVFLAIGGARIAVESELKKICPHLLRICRMAVANKEYVMVSYLICVLDEVPLLDKDIPQLLLSFIEMDISKRKSSLDKVIDVVDALSCRTDWYDRESLKEALSCACESGYSDLYNALKTI